MDKKILIFLGAIIFLVIVYGYWEFMVSKQPPKPVMFSDTSPRVQIIQTESPIAPETTEFSITSAAFENFQEVPEKYTCKGAGINPPLIIKNIPNGTISLALIVSDPDAAGGTFYHWVLFDIPAKVSGIEEGKAPEGARIGLTSAKGKNFVPFCPPGGEHRYFFKVLAINRMLELPATTTAFDLQEAANKYVIGQTQLIGLVKKK